MWYVADFTIAMLARASGLTPSVRPQPPSNTPVVSDLLKIIGTIPVVHYNTKFDVPIEMWIPEAYPYASPVCKIAISQGASLTPSHLTSASPAHQAAAFAR